MIKYFLFISFLFGATTLSYGQTTGSIQGRITDVETEDPLMFANLVILDGDLQVAVTQTDIDGRYNFPLVPVGTYDLVVVYSGYPNKTIPNVELSADEVRMIDIEMSDVITTTGIEVFANPIIRVDDCCSNKRDKEQLEHSPERNIGSTIASVASIGSVDEGEALSSAGSRITSNLVMINGIPILGGLNNLPLADLDIEEIQVLTSGIPAKYGNATGSVTNIVTKAPSSRFSGGFQAETSHFLDNFGATTLNGFVSGPIISKIMINSLGDTLKRNGKPIRSSILGYRLSGSFFNTKDNRPSALTTFRLSDDRLAELLANPLIPDNAGTGSTFGSDNLTQEDLVGTPVRINAQNSTAQFSGSLDFKPSEDFFIALNAEGQFNWGKQARVDNQLFNHQFNANRRTEILGFSARFRHQVSSTIPGNQEDEDGEWDGVQPVFQNLSYEVIGSYNQTYFSIEDPRYGNRFWEYGHVGKFYESRQPVIGVADSAAIRNSQGEIIGYEPVIGHVAFFNSFDRYEASTSNAGLASYNQLLEAPNSSPTAPTFINEMEIVNGLVTGNRTSVFGLYNAPHLADNDYTKFNQVQLRASVQANFDLLMNPKSLNAVRHKIELGGVFEQRIERRYNMDPFSLWQLGYQSANAHISNATDPSRPTGEMYYDPNTQRNYALYEALIREDDEGNEVEMSAFAANLRQALNLNKRDWIAVHELDPSQMRVEWFEPSTLITGTQRLITYHGYDYLGNPLGTNVQFNDFFNATDAQGRKTRPVAPYKPIYMAGYIQDKFVIKDLICNIGVRFDSYDANTSVLRDPYSVVGYETAAEFESDQSIYDAGRTSEYQRPRNIGDDYAVYVNSNTSDAAVVGYRNGSQWYNADGVPVNNSSELGANFIPALKGFGTAEVDPQGNRYDPNEAFQDYNPTVIVMPRISFSFPISKQANFYGNYDILSQRPPQGAYASAYDYYNFREITTGTGFINNPNLRPEKTVSYEAGFQQALSRYSKIKIAMQYKEERDLIQLRQYINAYPNTYTTFGNSDFSTTKIFKLEYETLRKDNLKILANYTLQFSEGTGSNPTSSAGVAARELSYVFALDFDQRHTFFVNLDYRFAAGKKYNGPKIGKVDILENTGLSVTLNAQSGRPFTSKRIPGDLTNSFPDRLTDGSINGSRLPWNVRVGLRLDRTFTIAPKSAKPVRVNVYLRITNLFNTQNVFDVYPVTGSPTDDGFLTTAGSPGPGFASSQPESYELLYNLRMNDPFNISRPRRMFLGLRFSF